MHLLDIFDIFCSIFNIFCGVWDILDINFCGHCGHFLFKIDINLDIICAQWTFVDKMNELLDDTHDHSQSTSKKGKPQLLWFPIASVLRQCHQRKVHFCVVLCSVGVFHVFCG